MSDFHGDCMKQICKQIIDLKLCGIGTGEVAVRRQPFRVEGNRIVQAHRGITIHPELEQEARGTNKSEDIGYGCGVTMILPADHSPQELGHVTEWRRLIRREFINQRLANVVVKNGHVCINTVEHADFAKDFDDHKYEISSLLIRVWVRETRS